MLLINTFSFFLFFFYKPPTLTPLCQITHTSDIFISFHACIGSLSLFSDSFIKSENSNSNASLIKGSHFYMNYLLCNPFMFLLFTHVYIIIIILILCIPVCLDLNIEIHTFQWLWDSSNLFFFLLKLKCTQEKHKLKKDKKLIQVHLIMKGLNYTDSQECIIFIYT